MFYPKTPMRWRPFLLYHTIAFLLIASWIFPPTAALWHELDTAVFYFLNSSLKDSPFSQLFWALANVKITDLYGAIFMALFSLIYVFEDSKEIAKQRLAQFFYICIWGEIGILFVKEAVGPFLISIDFLRESPTLIFKNTIRLSEAISWLKIKDHSRWSFPGDHAFIVLQWSGFITFFCGLRYGVLAYLSSIFFMLPRLIAGAHWITDVIVGSFSFALLILAWSTTTPLHGWLLHYLNQFSSFLFRIISSLPTKLGGFRAQRPSP